MNAPSFYTSSEAYKKAEQAIKKGAGTDLRDAIELLLQSEVDPSQDTKKSDAGSLLQKGLAALAKGPHDALGVEVGAKTQEIRKAYKKLALRYHPDKNPKTTPLFQAIQTAADKLTDPSQRRVEEAEALKNKKNPYAAYAGAPREPGHTSATYQAYMYERQQSKPPPYNPTQGNPSSSSSNSSYNAYQSSQTNNSYQGAEGTQQKRKEDPKPPPQPHRFPQPSSGYSQQSNAAGSEYQQNSSYSSSSSSSYSSAANQGNSEWDKRSKQYNARRAEQARWVNDQIRLLLSILLPSKLSLNFFCHVISSLLNSFLRHKRKSKRRKCQRQESDRSGLLCYLSPCIFFSLSFSLCK